MPKRSLQQRESDDYFEEPGGDETSEDDGEEVEEEVEQVPDDESELEDNDYASDKDDEEGEEEEELQVARVLNGNRAKKIVVTVVFGGRTHCRNREVVAQCQVDGCDADLQEAKPYHRKHKVCQAHAKAMSVSFGAVEVRYCQQCSRFHETSQFDGFRRSCRRRLACHNERRRKMICNISEEPPCRLKQN